MNFLNLQSYPIDEIIGDSSVINNGIINQIVGIIILAFLIILVIYLYFAMAFWYTAKKTGIENEWAGIAWLPFAWPYLMARMAKKPWWPAIVFGFLGFIIAIFFIPLGATAFAFIIWAIAIILWIFIIYWNWFICIERKKPAWWSLITPILIVLSTLIGLSLNVTMAWISAILSILGIIWMFVMCS